MDLYDHISTILHQADPAQTRFYSARKSPLEGMLSLMAERADPDNNLLPMTPEIWSLTNEQVILLSKFHDSLDASSRAAFVDILLNCFSRSSEWSKCSGHLFTCLARIDFTAATNIVLATLVLDGIGLRTLQCVSNFLKYDNARLADTQLCELEQKITKTRLLFAEAIKQPYRRPTGGTNGPTETLSATDLRSSRFAHALEKIRKLIAEIKYERLRENLLQDVNLEVNQDKNILAAELARFGFEKELIECLEHVETEFRKADSKFAFKTCSDYSRTFFETLLWQTAAILAKRRNEPIGARKNSAASVRDYLKQVGFLTERFHKLCEAFYQFVSDESAHQLSSAREVARITRNMNIEIGLLIVQRLGRFSGVDAKHPS